VVDWFAPAPKLSSDFSGATKIKKEVKMKRIGFLVIAVLLLMGLVLPGCGEGGGGGGGGGTDTRPPVTFAIAEAMTDITGINAWNGALMAQKEINDGAGINVGGEYHKVALVKVDTNEVVGSPDEGVTALEAVINDVDFVLGGFRTEKVTVYREVAMDAEKIMMCCGAATGALQYSVNKDYDRYKYWFKVTPYNENFLAQSLFRIVGTFTGQLKDKLIAAGDTVDPDYQMSADSKVRVAIIAEDAAWCAGLVILLEGQAKARGYDVVGTWKVSPTSTDISTELTAIAGKKPHLILPVFSGPVGITYVNQRAELGIPAMSIGINVPVQVKGAWTETGGKCNGDMLLDTWGDGMTQTSKTKAFFDDYVSTYNDYPGYCAATYDAIYSLKEEIEAVSAANGWKTIAKVVDPANIDVLIQYIETHPYTGTVGTTAYFPMPAIDLGAGTWALSEAQVRALYPDLGTYVQSQWQVASSATLGPCYAHDYAYGPGLQTGCGTQWQDGKKVGVWPIEVAGADLTDQYGDWNFQYAGTKPAVISIDKFLAS
jgi:branched-chain amino acid transport system substrate-binding protein